MPPAPAGENSIPTRATDSLSPQDYLLWIQSVVKLDKNDRFAKKQGGGQGDTKLTPTHRVYLCLHSQPPSEGQRSPPTLHLPSSPGCFQWKLSLNFYYLNGNNRPPFSLYRDLYTQARFGNYACARTDIAPRKPQHMS
jgi:hypothetical protein